MIFGPMFYLLFVNVAYTFGAALDTSFCRSSPRKKLFKAAYVWSLVLTALPGMWAVVAWLGTVVAGRKL